MSYWPSATSLSPWRSGYQPRHESAGPEVRKKGINIHLITVEDLVERLDWVMKQLGVSGGKPDLSVAPVPQFDASRHSTDELIAGSRGA